jgi:hypothetical protein
MIMVGACLLCLPQTQKEIQKGGVCIFVHKSLQFTSINLDRYCSAQYIEACAIQLDPTYVNICILAIYRSPMGKFNNFITQI